MPVPASIVSAMSPANSLTSTTSRVPNVTAKGRATRRRIIEGAAHEIRNRGVAFTTLDDVLAATSTSKSQLFHYFPGGKEELLLAVAQHEADKVLADQQPHLGALTSWAAWKRWRDALIERYRRQGQTCPLAVLTSEFGRNSPGAQAVTASLMRQWHGSIAEGIKQMQSQGKIASNTDAERAAAALLAAIQGGVGIMLATGDASYLEAALDVGIGSLRVMPETTSTDPRVAR
jgi:AcrR family transcriptional regulator